MERPLARRPAPAAPGMRGAGAVVPVTGRSVGRVSFVAWLDVSVARWLGPQATRVWDSGRGALAGSPGMPRPERCEVGGDLHGAVGRRQEMDDESDLAAGNRGSGCQTEELLEANRKHRP